MLVETPRPDGGLQATNSLAWIDYEVLATRSSTLVGLVAVAVALAGLHAMLAFLVVERRPEVAIRVALGASRSDIAKPVIRLGFLTVGVGLAAGMIVLLLAASRVEKLLFGVSLVSPGVVASTVCTCLVIAWLTTRGPARTAAKQDPMIVIRGG